MRSPLHLGIMAASLFVFGALPAAHPEPVGQVIIEEIEVQPDPIHPQPVVEDLGHAITIGKLETLDEIALKTGTDKASSVHNYTSIYQEYFAGHRFSPIKFLEIGIYQGYSVKMWEEYFPLAELHFIDIYAGNIEYHSNRSKYHFLDQANVSDLRLFSAAVGGDFDIIIDDGGHTMVQQINSFKELFPLLKSDGIYVIEDLETSYWKDFGGGGKIGKPKKQLGTTTEFLKALVDDINYAGALTGCSDFDKTPANKVAKLSFYQKYVKSIHFFSGLCIIIRR